MTSWLIALKAMIQQLFEPQQTLQPIKIEVEQEQRARVVQRRRRR
ncbi:hypothetical protein NBRC116188_25050 [Oceaniserpentilla sp. 4NH20-0058]